VAANLVLPGVVGPQAQVDPSWKRSTDLGIALTKTAALRRNREQRLLVWLTPNHSRGFVMKALYSLLVAALATAGMATASAADALYVDAQAVRQAQKALNDRGFRTGGVDGRMGPQTQAALVNFQRAEKLQPTGKLDGATLKALDLEKGGRSASANAAGRYPASTIRKAQETLSARGYKAGPANGVLGDETRAALRQFQKSENIAVTGRLNPRTLAHLGIEETASAGSSAKR
jgi:peptidoglycan hydrolase-like protein with peptidoglycan-binding domain